MWTGWVAVALVSACGAYTLQAHNEDEALAWSGTEATLAASMAVYRDAVVQYAHLHPAFTGKVADSELALPAWHAPPRAGLWGNYVDAAGTIVVYATRLPEIGITGQLAVLAQGSELAGRARLGSGTIEPAAHAGAAVALPAIPGNPVPDGAPVWLAYRY